MPLQNNTVAKLAVAALAITAQSADGNTIDSYAPHPMEAIYVFDSTEGRSFVYTGPSLLTAPTDLTASQLSGCVAPGTCGDVAFGADGVLTLTSKTSDETIVSSYRFMTDSYLSPGVYRSRPHAKRRGIPGSGTRDTGHLAVLWAPEQDSSLFLYDFESDAGSFLFLSPTLLQPGTLSASELNSCTPERGYQCSSVTFAADGRLVFSVGRTASSRRRFNEEFYYSVGDFATPGIYTSQEGQTPSTLRITEIRGAQAQTPTPEPGTVVLLGLTTIAFVLTRRAKHWRTQA
jgi:hypothetical protein